METATALATPEDPTYEASFSPDDQEVTVVENRRAGVCGPHGSYPANDTAQAGQALFDNGWWMDSSWAGPNKAGQFTCAISKRP